MLKRILVYGLSIIAAGALASPALGQTIMSPNVTADPVGTTVASVSTVYTLPQITDTIVSDAPNYNGFKGVSPPTNGWAGDINLRLSNPYDIDRFHLWNDINVAFEGIEDFTLRFYDINDDLVRTESFTAALGVEPMQTILLSTTVRDATRVVLQIDSVFQLTAFGSVEIREVAFSGIISPPAAKTLDNYMCYDLLAQKLALLCQQRAVRFKVLYPNRPVRPNPGTHRASRFGL